MNNYRTSGYSGKNKLICLILSGLESAQGHSRFIIDMLSMNASYITSPLFDNSITCTSTVAFTPGMKRNLQPRLTEEK